MERVQGFKDRIEEEYPEIEVLAEKFTEIDPAEAQEVVENWLTAFPEIDAVLTVAAPLGEGAARAVRAAEALVLTSTLNEGTFQMLESGMIDYVQSEQPVMTGRLATQLAINALNGEKVELPPTSGCCRYLKRFFTTTRPFIRKKTSAPSIQAMIGHRRTGILPTFEIGMATGLKHGGGSSGGHSPPES